MTLFALILLLSSFLLALAIRTVTGLKICALCASVTLTWLLLLMVQVSRGGVDPILLALLMGGSVVGLMYYISSKVPERYHVVKFAFLITLFWLLRLLIGGTSNALAKEAFLIVIVWIGSIGVLLAYTNGTFKEMGTKLIECCKNW